MGHRATRLDTDMLNEGLLDPPHQFLEGSEGMQRGGLLHTNREIVPQVASMHITTGEQFTTSGSQCDNCGEDSVHRNHPRSDLDPTGQNLFIMVYYIPIHLRQIAISVEVGRKLVWAAPFFGR